MRPYALTYRIEGDVRIFPKEHGFVPSSRVPNIGEKVAFKGDLSIWKVTQVLSYVGFGGMEEFDIYVEKMG